MAREQTDTQYPLGNPNEFDQEALPEPAPFAPNQLTAPDGSTTLSSDGNSPLIVEANGVNVGRQGHIRGGQSDYNTNSGFFMGFSGGQYKFSIGNPSGNYITWDGTTLTIVGNQVNVQTFDSSGTWTKLAGAKFVVVQAWGGGGGGSSCSTSGIQQQGGGGGGGGGYNTNNFNASDLSSTVTVTIPAASGHGVTGGNVTFGSYLTAYGGGASPDATANQTPGGGGGGGIAGGGSDGAGAGTGGVGGGIAGSAAGVSNGGFGGAGGSGAAAVGGSAVYGGAGGGHGANGSGSSGFDGGSSVYGGGGGGGGCYNGSNSAGGTSQFGGAGGAGTVNGNGVNGTVPGGGGGGAGANISQNFTGGSGAKGRIRVVTYL